MSNSYIQVYVHVVFAVKFRNSLIGEEWKVELYKYIIGIIDRHKHRILAINGMPDHIHVFVAMAGTQHISDMVKHIKGSSSKWINDHKSLTERFEWQSGFGAFSYSRSQIPGVVSYIQNQEIHHQKKSLLEEYKSILKHFDVEFNEDYIFKEME